MQTTDPIARLSTAELSAIMDDPWVQLVDVRSSDAYNGWPDELEARGGHIRGAISLPEKWAHYLDWLDIVDAKDCSPEHRIVCYGREPDDAERVAAQFRRVGFDDVAVYHDFVREWTTDPSLRMDCLPRYRHVVPAEWLNEVLSTGLAPTYSNKRCVVCHAHYRNPIDYRLGHIPGAIALDTNWLESPATWNRRSPRELERTLAALGITVDTTVVLNGRFSFPDNNDVYPGSSAGQLAAFRMAFIMLHAGVKDVRILNGGLKAWCDAGLPLSSEVVDPEPMDGFGAVVPGRPDFAVDLDEARRILASDDADLVSVRSWAEHIGETSGYNYIAGIGRHSAPGQAGRRVG